jgi:hypothetical protein
VNHQRLAAYLFLIIVKYKVKFTILTIFECASHWHQVPSRCATIITTIHLQIFSLFKLKLCPY